MMVHIVTVNGKPYKVFSNKKTVYKYYEEIKGRYDELFKGIACVCRPEPYAVVSMNVEEG